MSSSTTPVWERTDNDGWANVQIIKSVAGYYGPNPGPYERARIEEEDREKGAGVYVYDDENAKFKVDKLVRAPGSSKTESVRVQSTNKPTFGEWIEVTI